MCDNNREIADAAAEQQDKANKSFAEAIKEVDREIDRLQDNISALEGDSNEQPAT